MDPLRDLGVSPEISFESAKSPVVGFEPQTERFIPGFLRRPAVVIDAIKRQDDGGAVSSVQTVDVNRAQGRIVYSQEGLFDRILTGRERRCNNRSVGEEKTVLLRMTALGVGMPIECFETQNSMDTAIGQGLEISRFSRPAANKDAG